MYTILFVKVALRRSTLSGRILAFIDGKNFSHQVLQSW